MGPDGRAVSTLSIRHDGKHREERANARGLGNSGQEKTKQHKDGSGLLTRKENAGQMQHHEALACSGTSFELF
jgi:hypothetical protein